MFKKLCVRHNDTHPIDSRASDAEGNDADEYVVWRPGDEASRFLTGTHATERSHIHLKNAKPDMENELTQPNFYLNVKPERIFL